MIRDLYELPPDLPVPLDDGGTDHLMGLKIPPLYLESTSGGKICLEKVFDGQAVLFIYPRAGSPLAPNAKPELWDSIPGARGCTPQSCGFRDLFHDFQDLGISIYGLSVQSPAVQKEFVERNQIHFEILSDHQYQLTDHLNLPTFVFEGERLIKRMALYIEDRFIKKVFYPAFPPNQNAQEVLDWVRTLPKTSN